VTFRRVSVKKIIQDMMIDILCQVSCFLYNLKYFYHLTIIELWLLKKSRGYNIIQLSDYGHYNK